MQLAARECFTVICTRPAFPRASVPFKAGRISAQLSAAAIPSEEASTRSSIDSGLAGSPLQEATAVAVPSQSNDASYMEEYQQLKQRLLTRAKQGSGFLALYMFLQQGLVATGCSLLGSAAGYAYLLVLMRAVDEYSAETEVPLDSARASQNQLLRTLLILLAVYRQAINPRLLIPTSVALGVAAFNATQPHGFSLIQELDILLGFLFSYKSGLVSAIYDDIKPKVSQKDDQRPMRPSVAVLPDLEEERRERLLGKRRQS